MFCPQCGTKLPDGSRFCSACGARVSDPVEPEEPKQSMTENVEQIVPVQPSSPETNVAPAAPRKSSHPYPKKTNIPKLGVFAAAGVLLLVLLIWGISVLFSGGKKSDHAYALLSDGKYELITNLKKGEIVEIASSKSDEIYSTLLTFSPDGKYIYYYTKYDSDVGTGSLCRAEYGKMKKNTAKNDKYIEVLATNVRLGFRFRHDGTLMYQNADDTLYYFDGSNSMQLAKNVGRYYTDDSERVLYTTDDEKGSYTLYGLSLKDVDNKKKLASNCYNLCSTSDFQNVVFVRTEDDGSESLYVTGFDRETEKLAQNVRVLLSGGDKVFFTQGTDTKLCLYDYVEDEKAQADSNVKEPMTEDYGIPEYSYEMVYGSDLSESDFDELYTTCTKDLYWYGMSTWWCYSMEEALDVKWTDTEAVHAVTQDFIDRFADSANEDGFILVTDEVRAALQEIQKCAKEPEKEWQWLWLCYNKYQSGTTVDYDAYYEAESKWYEASARNELREKLKDPENSVPVRNLCCIENGKIQVLQENVLSTEYPNGAILFNTTEFAVEKQNLEKISSIYDVRSQFEIDREAENYAMMYDGSIVQMSARAAQTYAECYDQSLSGYVELYFGKKTVYLSDGNGSLYAAKIRNKMVEEFMLVTDDANVLRADSSADALYYASDAYENGNATYYDLYVCRQGESTCLARDVLLSNFTRYTDETILAYTGYRYGYGFELSMIDSRGEVTLIADNVTQYIRVDKSTLLYLSDGDLYSYNGKERKLVQSDVDWVWSRNEMQKELVIHYSYFNS